MLRAAIPVVINSFNQFTYLKNMVESLLGHGFRSITVLDQASEYPPLLEYLNTLHRERTISLVRLPVNMGPHWFFQKRVFRFVPSPFIFTDPDIALPDHLDNLFCLRLYEATERHQVAKAGCALDISTPEKFKDTGYIHDGVEYRIWEWEKQFWKDEVENGIFRAEIDTTFHLFNTQFLAKEGFYDGVRLAGPGFTARHLPWYAEHGIANDEAAYYAARTRFSTWL